MGSFQQRRYRETIRLLARACQLDPDLEHSDLNNASLGRSYLALGQHNEALASLSRAYEPYCQRKLRNDIEKREFLAFLAAFHEILQNREQEDRAQEVAQRIEELKRK